MCNLNGCHVSLEQKKLIGNETKSGENSANFVVGAFIFAVVLLSLLSVLFCMSKSIALSLCFKIDNDRTNLYVLLKIATLLRDSQRCFS